MLRANVHHAAVHSRRAEIADRAAVLAAYSEHDYLAAGLIFREKITGSAADNHERFFLHVLFHVYARAVARRALHKYLSVAHSIARRVADVAVNCDRSVVHGVADSVLRVSVNGDVALGQVRSERVSGNARNVYVLAHTAASCVALPEHIFYLYLLAFGASDLLVELTKTKIFSIDLHDAHAPFDRIS